MTRNNNYLFDCPECQKPVSDRNAQENTITCENCGYELNVNLNMDPELRKKLAESGKIDLDKKNSKDNKDK